MMQAFAARTWRKFRPEQANFQKLPIVEQNILLDHTSDVASTAGSEPGDVFQEGNILSRFLDDDEDVWDSEDAVVVDMFDQVRVKQRLEPLQKSCCFSKQRVLKSASNKFPLVS